MRILNIFLLILPIACVPVAAIGGGCAIGSIAIKKKGIKGTINDVTLSQKIKNHLINKYKQMGSNIYKDIFIHVQNGEVLIIGTLLNQEDSNDVEKYVWEIDNVKNVINKIEISNETYTLKKETNDMAITTKAKSALISNIDSKINILNYKIVTYNGTVYILGISNSEFERTSVINAISKARGMKKIVCLARMPDELVKFNNVK